LGEHTDFCDPPDEVGELPSLRSKITNGGSTVTATGHVLPVIRSIVFRVRLECFQF
jgi:hypothetical protein